MKAERLCPEFFIVGAPKCGTTALWTYLSEHPSIFMSRIKEPNFFSSDLPGLMKVGRYDEYLDLFKGAPKGATIGEASIWYLFSEIAVRRVMQLRADAKVVAILRKPSDAARSFHAQRLRGLREDIPDFEEAWQAQEERAGGKRLPKICPEPRALQYGPIYRFLPQIQRLFDTVPERQRHIIIFEEFFADPREHYPALLEFLGVSNDHRREFPVVNPAQAIRSRALVHLTEPNALLPERLLAPLRWIAHALGARPRGFLSRLNSTEAASKPNSAAFEQQLRKYFADDIAKLEILLKRSLAAWR